LEDLGVDGSIVYYGIIIIRSSISIITQLWRKDGLNSRDSRLGLLAGSSGYIKGGEFVE
jgi:hypothetical protein